MEMEGGEGSDLSRLPEGLTSPRDSCRSSLISSTFRSAASDAAVWERFQPSDYPEILSRAVYPVEFYPKKELCDSIIIDGGKRVRKNNEMELPEACISNVLSLSSPRDACRLSLVSSIFRSATESDTVWERFLPSDYREILSRAVHPVEFSSKKELYFRLCDSILIDGGKKSFALEKSSGRKCYMLSARELVIVGVDSPKPKYWRWIPLSSSRFSEVAELLGARRLEINGKINTRVLSPNTTYGAFLIFKLRHTSRCLDFPYQETSVKVGTHVSKHTVWLQPDEDERRRHEIIRLHRRAIQPYKQTEKINGFPQAPRRRDDGWMEMELGWFFNSEGFDGEVDMSLMEVKGRKWKGGLIIQGIEVRPRT